MRFDCDCRTEPPSKGAESAKLSLDGKGDISLQIFARIKILTFNLANPASDRESHARYDADTIGIPLDLDEGFLKRQVLELLDQVEPRSQEMNIDVGSFSIGYIFDECRKVTEQIYKRSGQ